VGAEGGGGGRIWDAKKKEKKRAQKNANGGKKNAGRQGPFSSANQLEGEATWGRRGKKLSRYLLLIIKAVQRNKVSVAKTGEDDPAER